MTFKRLTPYTHKRELGAFILAACHAVSKGENKYEYTLVLEKPEEGDYF